ncbi:acetyl-CoA sensor PanZ family protein [Succinimonas sp.]|uniref:acetyl-CoA sensor PanZ family protein n=1 Tax=Succinimonas sp. TaxID=1936151 RepID=UPI00386A61BA
MRLTVFHNHAPEALWEKSLNKLITPLAYQELKKMGDVHLAVFNDGVVGISVSKNDNIVYLKVRDITRRRGVGKYLIEETCAYIIESGFDAVSFDIKSVPVNEQDGMIYFLEMQGFIQSPEDPLVFIYREDFNDDDSDND